MVDAALKLFSEKGFDATTTEDIAEAADVSQRTFFRHFPVKEAVLYADMEEYIDQAETEILSREGDAILAIVHDLLIDIAKQYQTPEGYRMHRARLEGLTASVLSYGGVIQTEWINTLTDAIAKRMGVSASLDLRPGLVASTSVGALWVASTKWIATDGKENMADLVEEALAMINFNFEI